MGPTGAQGPIGPVTSLLYGPFDAPLVIPAPAPFTNSDYLYLPGRPLNTGAPAGQVLADYFGIGVTRNPATACFMWWPNFNRFGQGLGNALPEGNVHIDSDGSGAGVLLVGHSNNFGDSCVLEFRRTRGTFALPTDCTTGTFLATLIAAGWGSGARVEAAAVEVYAAEAYTTGAHGAQVSFYNVTTGTANIIEALRLTAGANNVAVRGLYVAGGSIPAPVEPSQPAQIVGNVLIDNAGTAGKLMLREPSAGGSSVTTFAAPALAADVNYTLPAVQAVGDLSNDGLGNLSWQRRDAAPVMPPLPIDEIDIISPVIVPPYAPYNAAFLGPAHQFGSKGIATTATVGADDAGATVYTLDVRGGTSQFRLFTNTLQSFLLDGQGGFGTPRITYPTVLAFLDSGTGKTLSISQAKINPYNNITTVSNGVPAIYAEKNLTAQGAATAGTALITPAAAGMFRISVALTLTRAGSVSSVLGGAGGVKINYTTGDGATAKNQQVPFMLPGITTQTVINTNTNTVGDTLIGEIVIYSSTTAITYDVGYTNGGGATSMQYALRIRVEAL